MNRPLRLLIDGYNLLHAAGLIHRPSAGALERARTALLSQLAGGLTEAERAAATIVFDSADGYDRQAESLHAGIQVLFAQHHDSADDLLIELIRQASAPKQLLVVSSDHRVQQAAMRRRAAAIDSARWWDDLQRRRNAPPRQAERDDPAADKPLDPDTARWLKEFGEN